MAKPNLNKILQEERRNFLEHIIPFMDSLVANTRRDNWSYENIEKKRQKYRVEYKKITGGDYPLGFRQLPIRYRFKKEI